VLGRMNRSAKRRTVPRKDQSQSRSHQFEKSISQKTNHVKGSNSLSCDCSMQCPRRAVGGDGGKGGGRRRKAKYWIACVCEWGGKGGGCEVCVPPEKGLPASMQQRKGRSKKPKCGGPGGVLRKRESERRKEQPLTEGLLTECVPLAGK